MMVLALTGWAFVVGCLLLGVVLLIGSRMDKD